jgi:hypothetical protein
MRRKGEGTGVGRKEKGMGREERKKRKGDGRKGKKKGKSSSSLLDILCKRNNSLIQVLRIFSLSSVLGVGYKASYRSYDVSVLVLSFLDRQTQYISKELIRKE